MTDFDPRDAVDIPDDRELDDHIPDAVCDVQTDAYQPTIRELVDAAVAALGALVGRTIVQPTDVTLPDWMEKAILNADIEINQVQDTFRWVEDPSDPAYWWPPRAEEALTFDECEAAGVDGTLRDM